MSGEESKAAADHGLLEAQLRQAQKMEVVGQLAGGLAHDFNNILTTILAHVELLSASLDGGDLSQTREDLDRIRKAAIRGGQMIRRLLGFSRRSPLDLRLVPLSEVVWESIGLLRRLLPGSIEVLGEVEEEVRVYADPGAVEQMLFNLATNARDAMPGGGVIRMQVGTRDLPEEHFREHGWGPPGRYGCLTFSDTGEGMPAEVRSRLFEPFFTTKPAGRGSGLGLTMVYGLMKEHRGFVQVESSEGYGTSVRLLFPFDRWQGETR